MLTLDEVTRARIQAATVRLPSMGGQGVLVQGSFVLTAAHCVTWNGTGGMALGDYMLEKVKTADGTEFRMQLVAVEPSADIAVLAPADDGELPKDWEACTNWIESIEPVLLHTRPLGYQRAVPAFVFTHRGTWLVGQATRWSDKLIGSVHLASQAIEGGTSGGPIVGADGALLGVVSWSGETKGDTDGAFPFAVLALPGWVVSQIRWPDRGFTGDDRRRMNAVFAKKLAKRKGNTP